MPGHKYSRWRPFYGHWAEFRYQEWVNYLWDLELYYPLSGRLDNFLDKHGMQ